MEWLKFLSHLLKLYWDENVCHLEMFYGVASIVSHTCDLHTCIHVKLTIISLWQTFITMLPYMKTCLDFSYNKKKPQKSIGKSLYQKFIHYSNKNFIQKFHPWLIKIHYPNVSSIIHFSFIFHSKISFHPRFFGFSI